MAAMGKLPILFGNSVFTFIDLSYSIAPPEVLQGPITTQFGLAIVCSLINLSLNNKLKGSTCTAFVPGLLHNDTTNADAQCIKYRYRYCSDLLLRWPVLSDLLRVVVDFEVLRHFMLSLLNCVFQPATTSFLPIITFYFH